jgi:dihydrofolate reductase
VGVRDAQRAQAPRDGGRHDWFDTIVAESLQNIGATIMGRRMFGGGDGPWGNDPWRGWRGENPRFHTPVFVLTHLSRNSLEMEGGTTFHFVTEAIHAALEWARNAAAGKDIALGGAPISPSGT